MTFAVCCVVTFFLKFIVLLLVSVWHVDMPSGPFL
jgi:hypothetical protein